MSIRVQVPREVFEGIEAVRLSGLTNMLDRALVAEIVDGMGYEQAARWVRANPALYARGVFHGFEVIEKPGGESKPPQPKEK